MWTGHIDKYGYGRTSRRGYSGCGVHRIAWEKMNGPIPKGLQVDHLCRNRACINVAHMELVTSAENTRRGGNAAKTHCKRGHAFTIDNTYVRKDGTRHCRACRRKTE